jgi:hypothetical protein
MHCDALAIVVAFGDDRYGLMLDIPAAPLMLFLVQRKHELFAEGRDWSRPPRHTRAYWRFAVALKALEEPLRYQMSPNA